MNRIARIIAGEIWEYLYEIYKIDVDIDDLITIIKNQMEE